MVRVKNRWLLIEILYPDNVVPPVTGLTESTPVVLSNSPSPLLGSKQVSGSKQAGPHRTKSQSNSQSQLQSQSQSQLQRHHARDPALLLQYHKPTDDRLTPQVLLRTIRDNVAELFGDYGVGKISGSLAGTFLLFPHPFILCFLFVHICPCFSNVCVCMWGRQGMGSGGEG